MHARTRLTVALAVFTLGSPAAAEAALPAFSHFPANSGAFAIARGNANAWFTDDAKPGAIGRIAVDGTATAFTAGLSHDAQPHGIAAGPGGMWVAERNKDKIALVAAGGAITEFNVASHHQPVGIAAGPDGNVWYTAWDSGGTIARITPSGAITEFSVGLTKNGTPQGIALGGDGNLWVTLPGTRRIARVTPQGVITEFGTGLLSGTPQEITAGADGNVWFTENGAFPAIGRITPAGSITEFTSGLPFGSTPRSITSGADGALYATDGGANAVLRVTTGGAISQYGATLPTGASPQGITTGGDGMLWFAEQGLARIGRLSVAPTAAGAPTADVTDTTATLLGDVTANSQATTVTFELGTTTAYGTPSTGTATASGAGAQRVSATVTGLTPSQTYHARMIATNATGTTYGPDQTFRTTAPGAPSATSLPAAGVGADRATLQGRVNPEGNATTLHFEWGLSGTTYPNRVPATELTAGAGTTPRGFAQSLNGLAPNTTYHARVVASSAAGTTTGADQAFTTIAPRPDATTGAARDVTGSTATLTGVVDPENSVTTYHFEWGATDAYGDSAPVAEETLGADHAPHAVSAPLDSLTQGTTYHYRVVSSNNSGTTYGADATFVTPAPPEDGTPAVADPPAAVPAAVSPEAALHAELGRTAVASATGSVLVRAPGSTRAVEMSGATSIPSGSVIDTRNGTIALRTVVDTQGHTQSAHFRGATFRLQLSRTSGMVDLYLTGKPAGCGTHRATARAATAARPVSLWGKDHKGKYRTHGRTSVATVRGTEWSTRETCAGTVTRVMRGAVSVADKRSGRTTVVRAGHSHLARTRP